ncbi:purine-cytosine permease family protein [Streptomyces albipurpureus]|uniref:Cytosine permease n=1 Tax=Streptomyces albipurpureus TaxID=2897419 RepID=A0ABT0ULL3_9ACTN|nr:cytosine permease [Streptomyces sp. CWNU-1]MCM2388151.1 cytosine permease [Streptomyces sp. CWNU-1]
MEREASGKAGNDSPELIESKGIELVRPDERTGILRDQTTLWFSANVQFAALTAGALSTAIFGLDFLWAAVAIVLGTGLGSAALAILAGAGPRVGAAQLVQSRAPFGHYGNLLPAAAFFLTATGWFAVSVVLGVFTVQALVDVPFAIACVLFGVAIVAIAVFGYRVIHAVEKVLSVILLVLFLIVTGYALFRVDFGVSVDGLSDQHLGVGGAFATVAAICAARCLGFAAAASDYSRYLPAETRPKDVARYVFAGSFVGGTWMGLVGAALGLVAAIGSPADLITGILPTALGVIAMIALMLSTAASSCIDIYSSSLATLVMGFPLKRWVSAVIVGGLGVLAAWYAGTNDYYRSFETFLIFLGYWLGPWVAIMLVQLRVGPRGAVLERRLYDRTYRVGPGLIAWVIGFAASIPFMNQFDIYIGPFAKANPGAGDLTSLIGAVVAALAYAVLARRGKPAPVRPALSTEG